MQIGSTGGMIVEVPRTPDELRRDRAVVFIEVLQTGQVASYCCSLSGGFVPGTALFVQVLQAV